MVRMQEIFVIVIMLILLISSCRNNENSASIKKIHFDITNEVDSQYIFRHTAFSSIPGSMDVKHYMYSFTESNILTAFLNNSGDSIYIIEGNKIHKIPVPYGKSLPVESIYFHNNDSIFVFINRVFVYKNSNDSMRLSDFLLLDSTGNILDRYELNDVDYIYKGNLNPMIFMRKFAVNQKRIINKQFYLPFSIYQPSISDSVFANYNFKMICEYNLSTHKYRMLDIHFPRKDLGRLFNNNVLANTIDFQFINDSIIIYSFDYSSDIYSYNILNDSVMLMATFPDFIFNNYDTSHFSTTFYAPQYVESKACYLRRIKVRGFLDKKPFSLTQVLDKEMNLLGYSFEDTNYSAVTFNANGDYIVFDKKREYLPLIVNIDTIIQVCRDNIITGLPVKKAVNKSSNIQLSKNLSYEIRLKLYIDALPIEGIKKIAFINTDIVCADCIKFFMEQIKREASELRKKKLKFVFFGEDLMFAVNILKDYGISSMEFVIIDDMNVYKNYIYPDEVSNNPLVSLTSGRFKVYLYDPADLEKTYKNFLSE